MPSTQLSRCCECVVRINRDRVPGLHFVAIGVYGVERKAEEFADLAAVVQAQTHEGEDAQFGSQSLALGYGNLLVFFKSLLTSLTKSG